MPPLEITDLPTPEEVFKVKRIGLVELFFLVLGPAIIGVAISVGSGEWMLGPLAVSQYGFMGIGWVILMSAALQTFYNVELARFTIATGESPFVYFGRVPPGWFIWIPLTLFCFYLAFILGGWAVAAGSSLFTLFTGRPNRPDEIETVRLLGVVLLLSTFTFVLVGKKIEKTLEISMGVFVTFILVGLVIVTATVVPFDYMWHALLSLVTFTAPPKGTDPSLIGALAGFTALAAGLNFMIIGYYRDKGFGMGHKTGYLSAIISGEKTELSSGKIFPESEKNSAVWKRWFRYLLIDQWGIFFIGCMIGMMMPCILVGYLSSIPGAEAPTRDTILVYAGIQLGQMYGPLLFGWALLMGFFILYTTQIIILEMLTRAFTDAAYGVSTKVRKWSGSDPRRIYYTAMFLLIIAIGIIIHVALPVELLLTSANLSNLASMIFPLALMYLNSRLPRPARITWWSYLVLASNSLFFGFFFVNFVTLQITGSPMVRF